VLAAPIGEDSQIRGFFKCLQREYIGANRFVAPKYWRSTRRTKLFAAPSNDVYSICWSKPEVEIELFQDGGQIIKK
jgi:hypothetical protein